MTNLWSRSVHVLTEIWKSNKTVGPMQEEVPLGVPDVLICSVGTEIFFEKPGSDGAEPQPDKKWIQLLDQGWNRQAALDAAAQCKELKPQVHLARQFATASSSFNVHK